MWFRGKLVGWCANCYEFGGKILCVMKVAYVKSSMFTDKLCSGMGHNNYGEPA